MNNQKLEDVDIVEGLLLFCEIRFKRIAISVILVLPSVGNDEFSEIDIQYIKEAFDCANKNQKLRRYDSKQVIVIYEETE